MSERIGYVLLSMDTMTELMSGTFKLPKGTEVLQVKPEATKGGMEIVRMNFTHPALDVINESDEIPEYAILITRGEDGEYSIMFERVANNLPRKKYAFSDRFDLEQEILRLWGMFDYIHLIVRVLDRKGSSIDDVANIAWGLVNMMKEQHNIVYSYDDADYLSVTFQMQASKLYKKLDDLMSDYYDGPVEMSKEQMIQGLLRIQKEGDELFNRIFEEFEEVVCRAGRKERDIPF